MKKRDFLKSSLYAVGGLGLASTAALTGCNKPANLSKPLVALSPGTRNKRELFLSALDLSKPNKYVPAAFFLHFKDKSGPGAIKSHLEFFRATNMDIAKIQYEVVLPQLTNIKEPKDWATIPVYGKEVFGPQLEVIKAIVKELKTEALVFPTVYSPFSLAVQSVGRDTYLAHAKQDPEAVAKGIKLITDSILYYIDETAKLDVDGFYISTQGGDINNLDNGPLFDQLIAPFDKTVLQEADRISLLNILHICDYGSSYTSLKPFISYPGSIINPPIRLADNSPVKPKDVQTQFGRPVFGGLDRLGVISTGTPEQIIAEVDKVLKEASPNFILAADCTVDGNTSWKNLRAAIDYAHDWRVNKD
jgi:uroporphyrinogen decarboxylase